ncbi:MAG: hypothetical protein ABSH31_15395 [Bryobacteraceae bacterium]
MFNGTAAAEGRTSCCGPDACVLPFEWLCEWQGGAAGELPSESCTRQRAKHWAFASASATESKMKILAQAQRMRLQINMHSLQ